MRDDDDAAAPAYYHTPRALEPQGTAGGQAGVSCRCVSGGGVGVGCVGVV